MRIVFYLHRFPAIGGIENVTAFLANAFVSEGHAVEVVSHIAVKGQEAAQNVDSRVKISTMPEMAYSSRLNRNFFRSYVEETKPDVIIFQDSYAPIERNLYPVADDVPVIVCEHNAPYEGYEEPVFWGRTLRSIVRKAVNPIRSRLRHFGLNNRRRLLYRKCWRYVLLSDRFFGEFRAVTGLADSRKLMAIPNPNLADKAVASVQGKKDEIVFVGTVNYRKGCDMLLEIWRRIAPRHPEWSLTIVGDGPLRAALESRLGTLGIPRVEFEGYQTDPSPYFKRARLFVFPSRREGWGLVIQEAQSFGCVPIVFDSYASVRDIVSDSFSGVLVPPFDCAEFAARLENLMADREMLDRLSKGALQAVQRNKTSDVLSTWRRLLSFAAKEETK